MTKTPEEIEEDKICYQEYDRLCDSEAFDDILTYHNMCSAGYGPKQGEGMEDQEIVETFADENVDKKSFFINAIPQGHQLLAMVPFLWRGLRIKASRWGYNEAQVRQWLEDQLKLLEAEAKKRGWPYLVR